MGSETSKLQAPEEFGQSGNQFQIISPVSDLSCPSDIHRINRLRNQQRGPADPSRRMSKTFTKSLSNKNHAGGVPAPARFYFPTKETEKAIERAERKSLEKDEKENQHQKILRKTKKVSKSVMKKTHEAMKKTHKAMQGCFADDNAAQLEEMQRMEEMNNNNINKHHPTLGIARKILPKKSKNVNQYDANQSNYKAMDDPSVTPITLKNERPTHVGYHVPSTQKKPYSDAHPLLDSAHKEQIMFKHPALHEADDYFSRLTGESSGGESPYVENKAMLKAMPSALGLQEPDSPVSNLFDGEEAKMPSPDSSLAESDIQRSRHSLSTSGSEPQEQFKSPSGSVLAYQKAIGTIAETPGYYPENEEEEIMDDKMMKHEKTAEELVDEITEKANRALATIAEKTDDEETSSDASASLLKQKNSSSAFRPGRSSQTTIQSHTMTALSSYDASDRKVSKLESLFRPVMPALSADDAESRGSFDRYEIKVTESAPSVLEGNSRGRSARGPTREMTALERKLGGLNSPSMLSMDSQASAAMAKSTLSKQAQYNGEFLFSVNKKTIQGSNKGETHGMASINTLGSRNRLSSRPGSKAIVISQKNMAAMDDQSCFSKDESRQVRFSLLDAVSASVGLAPKESIDVPTVESRMSDLTEAPYNHQKETSSLETVRLTPYQEAMKIKDNSNSPFLRFQSAKNCFESSNEATIDIPEIQNKVSDLTESSESRKKRSSTGTADSSIPETLQEEVENPENVSEEPQQVHWSYSVKDGNISAVTPYFGKDAKNTTKSPYLRFENARSMFGADKEQASALIKKETSIIKKKDVLIKNSRNLKAKQNIKLRSLKSGGSVASKVEALNQRVVDAKIDRKMHRWTKSNPRKYGVVESNAVRTRAIVQYKTDVVGLERFNYMSAAKFNTIPIDDDESSVGSSVAASRHSKKSVTFADQQPPSLLQLQSEETQVVQYDDDETSKLSSDDMSKLTIDSHSTVRRDRSIMSKAYSANARVSESTYSTASSGVSKIKKQIFRGSESTRQSVVSQSESTTMSSVLEKENADYSQFRAEAKTVKPTEQSNITKLDLHLSPAPAQKWRSLAAAAQMRDSQKKPIHPVNSRKGLAVKNRNVLAAYGY